MPVPVLILVVSDLLMTVLLVIQSQAKSYPTFELSSSGCRGSYVPWNF